jgi:uncharacterized protein YjiS (DUF1127 family)
MRRGDLAMQEKSPSRRTTLKMSEVNGTNTSGSGVLSKTSGVPIIGLRRTSDYVRPRQAAMPQGAVGPVEHDKHMRIAEMTMSTTFTAPAAPQGIAGQSWARKLVTTLERWWIAYMTWRVKQAAIAALSAMTNRELKDIGLTRSEIASAVSKLDSRLVR